MKQGVANAKKAEADAKTVIVKARFTTSQAAAVDAAWKGGGFANRSAFLRHAALFVADGSSQPPALLEEMRAHRRELGAVGRNINQLAFEMNRRKKAGIAVDPALLVRVEDLQALREEIKAVSGTLGSILKKVPKERRPKP